MTEQQQHPITPPPELVGQWLCDDGYPWDPSANATITITTDRLRNITTQAARWGADQELEACCTWLRNQTVGGNTADVLERVRRPKPPSLKEQALQALDSFEGFTGSLQEVDTIRRALEQLDD